MIFVIMWGSNCLAPFSVFQPLSSKKDIDNHPNVWYYNETPEKMNTKERQEK